MINLKELEEIVKSINLNLTEEDIFNFLKISKRWPIRYPWGQHSVEILCNNEHLECMHFFNINSYLNFNEWKRFYDLGFTSIISNVLDLNEELRLLNKKLTENTGLEINGNFYFSKPGQRASFDSHHHEYDVIVKQIYGTAEWQVNNQFFTLSPSETCIIPKNVVHQVLNKNKNKLSLTINIQ